MDKAIYVSMLLEMYGKLLTNKQFDIVDLYYNQNLSLAEIAENLNITRQGVRKSLIDSEEKLIDIENKLGFIERKSKLQEEVNKIAKAIEDKSIREKLLNLL